MTTTDRIEGLREQAHTLEHRATVTRTGAEAMRKHGAPARALAMAVNAEAMEHRATCLRLKAAGLLDVPRTG